MNNNKHLKPNLLDSIVEKKIIKTLKPPDYDYWAPAKSGAKTFFENYIKPNIGFVVFIIIIIIFLIYRYRVTKKDKETKEIENIYKNNYNNELKQLNNNQTKQNKINKNLSNLDNSQEYSNLLLYLYNQQKEKLREPQSKNNSNKSTLFPKLAYPMYPNVNGGSLAPANSR